MLKLFVIWPVAGLSPCPFDLSPSFLEHLLTFRQKRFLDSFCTSPAPALESAVFAKEPGFSWLRRVSGNQCLAVQVLLAAEILLLVLSIEKASIYIHVYTYTYTHILYIHMYSDTLHLQVFIDLCIYK